MTVDQIKAAIPHREPMLLVDAVLERTAERIVCRKTFRADEFFLQGHYPENPLVPGVILCEVSLQAGALLLSAIATTEGIPVATRLSDVRFRQMVRPGDTILAEVQLQERLANAFFMQARLTRDGKAVARLQFACAAAEPGA
jgi:3-hydroxyacyl-[acyl-carrier-protein] dehydratase